MKKIFIIFLKKSSFTFYKRTLALVLAFVMIFNLSSEVLAQTLPSKNFFQNQLGKQQEGDLLSKELEKKHKMQEVVSMLGVSFEQYKKEVEKYAKANKIKVEEIDLEASYYAYSKEVLKYYNDYHALIKIFAKKTINQVFTDGRYFMYNNTKAEEVKYEGKEYIIVKQSDILAIVE